MPVPGLDYFEPVSERKYKHNPISSSNPPVPSPSSSQKTPSKATPKTEIAKSSSYQNKNSRSATQNSAANVHTSIDSIKSKGISLPKKSSATKSKATTSRNATSKQVVKPGSKVLSAELVTVSDDEDSGVEVNDLGQEVNGEKRGAWIAEKELGKNGVGRSDDLAKTNGLPRKRVVSSVLNPSSEQSGGDGNGSITRDKKLGGERKHFVPEQTNGLVEKRTRITNPSSMSDSDNSSESDNGLRNNNVLKEARKRKNAATSSSQVKTGGSPAKRARSSGFSEASITSDNSSNVSSESDKMEVDESTSNGIGPSAQPDVNANRTAYQVSGNVNANRHIQSKQQTSRPLSDVDSGSGSSSSSSNADSSTSQSDIAIDDRMDTSADKNITKNANIQASVSTPKKATPSSRMTAARSASTSHLNRNTDTTATPAITPPPPPESLSQPSLSSFGSKQIWHITLPGNIPIGSIRTIPSSAMSTSSTIRPQTPVVVHDGADYMLSRGSEAEERDAHVFVAATDDEGRGGRFKRLKRDVDAVWHVRLATKMPKFPGNTRQADSSDASQVVDNNVDNYGDMNESSDSSEPMLRPLPQGLKMRWLPSGCAPYSDDSEVESVNHIDPGINAVNAKATPYTTNTSDNHTLMQGLVFRDKGSRDEKGKHKDQAQGNSNNQSITSTDVEATKTNLSSKSNKDDINNTKRTKDDTKPKSRSKSNSKRRIQPSDINDDGEDITSFSKTKDLSAVAAMPTSTPKASSSPPHKSVPPSEQIMPSFSSSITAPAKATSPSIDAKAAKKAQKEDRRQRKEQKALKKIQKQKKEGKNDESQEKKVNHESTNGADRQEVETEMDRKRKKQEKKERKEKKRERKREKLMNE